MAVRYKRKGERCEHGGNEHRVVIDTDDCVDIHVVGEHSPMGHEHTTIALGRYNQGLYKPFTFILTPTEAEELRDALADVAFGIG